MGDEQEEVIEIIGGYDDSTGIYPMRSFDNQSKFTIMPASIDPDGVLRITGDGIRSTLRHDQSGRYMQALWERSDDGKTWIPWMEMQFTKL